MSATGRPRGTGRAEQLAVLRRMTLTSALLVVVQSAVGMVVNLYVTVPNRHPGSDPVDYFSGSLHSVIWAIGSGPLALAIHAALGLAVVGMVLALAVRALISRAGWVSALSVLAAGLVIGAGFNGASFLDFRLDLSSLLMALLSLGAVSCYLVSGSLIGAGPERH